MTRMFGVHPFAAAMQNRIEDSTAQVEPLAKGLGAAALLYRGKTQMADPAGGVPTEAFAGAGPRRRPGEMR
jgi:hypothetical protein